MPVFSCQSGLAQEPRLRVGPRSGSVRGHAAPGVWVAAVVAAGLAVAGVTGHAGATPAAITATSDPPVEGPPFWGGLGAGFLVGAIGAVVPAGLVIARWRKRCDRTDRLLSAVRAYAAGERDPDALTLADETAEAAAWNGVVADAVRREAARRRGEAVEQLERRRGGRDGSFAALDDVWHGLVLLDEHGVVLRMNSVAASMLRIARDAAGDRTIGEHPGCDEIGAAAQDVISGRRSHASVVFEHDDGGQRTVLRASVRPARKQDSGAMLVMVEDVTQQRAAEDARAAMVAHATHELRTPLTNIRLYVEQIMDGDEDPAERARALQVISQESRRLERVVADMLSMSEIESGSLTLRQSDVNLRQVFEELVEDFRAQAEKQDVALDVDLPPKYPRAVADREKLILAVHNVVGNAIKYTPGGGSVRVEVEADETLLTVRVADTGVGIAADEHERVFERFYRAKSGLETRAEGTGLGLPLAREVVRLHGGDIALESEPGSGSTFTVTVPIGEPARTAA